MSGRDAMLTRIREALQNPSAHAPTTTASIRDVLPPAPTDWDGMVGAFRSNAEQLNAEFFVAPSIDAAAEHAAKVAVDAAWEKVLVQRDDLTTRVATVLSLPILWVEGDLDIQGAAACDASITTCEALVAQTGSVLVSARSSGGRTPSVLPRHHVVIATRSQLVADLPAALERIGASSCYSLISGPSRTGDIERILVLGAHGPARLTVVLVEE